ncbi:MAG: S8 family serine peptidase [Pirellulales bacterium]
MHRSRRLHLERLENRLVLSASAAYSMVSPTWFAVAPVDDSAPETPAPPSQEWIIRLTAEATQAAGNVAGAAALLDDLPLTVVRGLGLPGQLLVTATLQSSALSTMLAGSALVASFQQDAIITGAELPNDPDFVGLEQYGLFNVGQNGGLHNADIDADLAWDITTGSSNVVVAVIDSGIDYTHPDLAANVWTNIGEIPGDGIDNDGNGYVDDVHGWDFHNDDNDPFDDHGHGTHIAGIIGAEADDEGPQIGGAGINWNSSLMALKFLDENNVGSVFDAIAAINYATMMRTRAVNPVNVRVINASWGGSGVDDQGLRDAIAASAAADVLFVAAAGNGDVFGRGQNIDTLPFFPASFGLDNMLVVAATDRHDQLTTFTNYGANSVDIAAPGQSIHSTNLFIDNNQTLQTYGTRSGTSMATPLVAGTAALIWSQSPTATAAEVRDAILAGGNTLATLQGKIASGKRLNAHGALLALPPQAEVTSALDVTNIGGTTYEFTVELSSNVPIAAATVGSGDFVVRRQNAVVGDLVASLVSATPSAGNRVWTVTYQITPPGGAWNVFDGGAYDISLVSGQVVDINGVASRAKVVDSFLVDLSSVGVFRPDVFFDGGDYNFGDGIAATITGEATLRAAIQEANLFGFDHQNTAVVILAPGTYTLSLDLQDFGNAQQGDLDILGNVVVASDGTGEVIIDAAGIDRVFDILTFCALTLEGVTITGGSVSGEEGGGIRNAGTLTVSNSTIRDNFTDQYGGGIYNAGTLSIGATTLTGNQAAFGGGIYNAEGATADVKDTTISGNTADAPNPQGRKYDTLSEERQLGSAAAGIYYAAASATGLGEALVTWEWRTINDIDGRFVSASSPIATVSEFTINDPFVDSIRTGNAIDSSGRAIVVWQATGADAEATGIQARLYDASVDIAGSSGSGIFLVNTTQGGPQSDAEVASNASGAVVAVWRSTEGGSVNIRARRLTTEGTFAGDDFVVNATVAGDKQYPDVAVRPDGSFVVVWQSDHDGTWSVFERVYDSSGAPLSGEILVNQTVAGSQVLPRVDADESGTIVVWEDSVLEADGGGVYARTFDVNGYPLVNEFRLSSNPIGDQHYPRVLRLADGGFFAVWDSAGPDDTGFDLHGQQFSKNFQRVGSEIIINQSRGGDQIRGVVAQLSENELIVAWEDPGVAIYGRIISASFHDGGGTYNAGSLTATNVTISGNEAANQGGGLFDASGGTATVASATVTDNLADGTGLPTDLTRVGGEVLMHAYTPGLQHGPRVAFNQAGNGVLVWDSQNTTILAQRLGTDAQPVGSIFQVNDTTTDHGDVAVAPNGDFAVIYRQFGGDADLWGVRGKIYNSQGVVIKPEFIVNGNVGTNQTSHQLNAIVEALPDGGYVVTWYDHFGGMSIWAQILNANGSFRGTAFKVNTATPGYTYENIRETNIWVSPDGTILISYRATPGGTAGDEVFARQFDSNGEAIGPEFSISGGLAGVDQNPAVAGDSDGFVVTWRNESAGMYLRRFDADAQPLGPSVEFATPVYNFSESSLAMLPNGNLLVVWDDYQFLAGPARAAMRGRILSREGAVLGDEFTVPSTPGIQQVTPSVAYAGDGRVLTVWGGPGPGDDYGIVAQYFQTPEYAAGGIFNSTAGSLTIKNSIVAANRSTDGDIDVAGNVDSAGGNLIGNIGDATGLSNGVNGDQVGTHVTMLDPKLGPLADNGGPTLTHLPAAESPAIDAAVSGGPTVDQRGVARPADGNNDGLAVSDIGAVEMYHASISGRKFQDQNQNGIQDVGEPGIAGWTMYLDLNQNGQLDSGEPSTVTGAEGEYAFEQLAPGTYTVAEVNQQGWTRTHRATIVSQEFLDGIIDGLDGASAVATVADNRYVYVAGAEEGKIARFERSFVDGQLYYLGATTTTATTQAGGAGANVLDGVSRLVVGTTAGVGTHLYALGPNGSIAIFLTNFSTGDLVLVDVVREGDNRGQTVQRLTGATGLAISADGARLYVSNSSASALNGGTILAFERVPGQTPELRLRRILSNGVASSPFGAGGRGVVVSSEGNQLHVYVAGENADASDTLATFVRVVGGAPFLSYSAVLKNGQPDSLGTTVVGLDGANDVALSPDGRHLYVSAATDGAVTLFARNDSTGVLTFVQSLIDGALDDAGGTVSGILEASSVTISDDGSRVYVTGKKDVGSPGDPFLVGAMAVFRRDPSMTSTGQLTFLHEMVDGTADAFGAPVENLESAVDVLAADGFVYVVSGDGEDALTVFLRDREGLDRKTLLVGENLTNVFFSSFAAPGEIRGAVYNDLNQNGTRDGDEYGLGGVTVYLDVDNSNTLNDGDILTSTSVLGEYVFANRVAPKNYTVRVALQNGQTVTGGPPATADGREWAISLDPDEIYIGADFLIHNALSGQGTSQISGFVWQDLDGDGERQDQNEGDPVTEPFLQGRQVYLDVNDNGDFNAGVDILATQPTSATGDYFFTGLGATNFAVRVVTNPGELTSNLVGNSFTKQTLNTGTNPLGLITADFDGDGLPDLASVDGSADKVSVRLQLFGGGFDTRTEYTVFSNPTALTVGLFNDDALPDIAVAHWAFTGNKIVFLLNDGDGTFTRSSYEIALPSAYTSIVAAGFVPGGRDDLAVALDGGGTTDLVRVFRNDSSGANFAFTALPDVALGNAGPLSIAAGLVNGDNLPDLVVGNFDADNVRVLLNNGGTSFTALAPVTVGDGPASVAIVPDMNGDGHRDVVVASIGVSTVTVLRGNGLGGLTLTTPIPVGQGPRSVAVADIDGDGDLDLIVGNTTSNDVVVVRNQGGTFSFPESSGLASFASLVASGVKQVLVTDLDGDGVLDLAAVRGDANTGSLAVLYNALAPGSHRLTLNGSNQVFHQNFGIKVAAPPLPGDYNRDGEVDAADHGFWSAHFGAATGIGLQADGNNSGAVSAADYVVWRDRLGASSAAGVSAVSGDNSGGSADQVANADIHAAATDAALADFAWLSTSVNDEVWPRANKLVGNDANSISAADRQSLLLLLLEDRFSGSEEPVWENLRSDPTDDEDEDADEGEDETDELLVPLHEFTV